MSRLDLARIKAKCEEDGDCLMWQGKLHKKTGSPAGSEWVGRRDSYVGVRRRAYEEYHGVSLTKDQLVTCTCNRPACLAKEHLALTDISERSRLAHARMDAGAKLRRSQALAKAQAWKRKLSDETAALIRDSEEGPYVTAKKLGVSGVVASRIKRGLSYRDYSATHFAGLGAR
jgi:hypothetical protein